MSPELTVSSWENSRHEGDEAFKDDLNYRQRVAEGNPVPPEDQIPAMRAESWARVLRRDRHDHLHNLVQAIIGVLVVCVVFAVHWLVAWRAREAGAAAPR